MERRLAASATDDIVMQSTSGSIAPNEHGPRRPPKWKASLRWTGAALVVYLALAYLLMPWVWKFYLHYHPWLNSDPRLTQTSTGHAGDPLNVALIGTEAEVRGSMKAANWHPADPLGLSSDLRIGVDSVLDRPYEAAPVSNLFLFGRKEDLAFEQPVGDSPRHRHHVRFWKMDRPYVDGRPIWIGSGSYDKGVGLSHVTGQITHHIDPNVDTERDHVLTTLNDARQLSETFSESGFHQKLEGHNGGGDPWHTDGALDVGVIASQ
jgi:hypothetical protein